MKQFIEITLKEFIFWSKKPQFLISRIISMSLGIWRSVAQDEFSQQYRQVRAYTMCCNTRLYALYKAIHLAENKQLVGDVVECGAAKGGSAALMGLTLKALHSKRRLWVFDTFEGIPAPTKNDPDREMGEYYTGAFRGELSEVKSLFSSLDILSHSILVKGLFQDTLTSAKIQQIAVLHIDGDWYDSIMVCLESFYDRVVIGGIIQLDDFGYWAGARKAVYDFMQRYDLDAPLIKIDYEGRQWIKTKERRI